MDSREFIEHLSHGHNAIFANVNPEDFEAMIEAIVVRVVANRMAGTAGATAVARERQLPPMPWRGGAST